MSAFRGRGDGGRGGGRDSGGGRGGRGDGGGRFDSGGGRGRGDGGGGRDFGGGRGRGDGGGGRDFGGGRGRGDGGGGRGGGGGGGRGNPHMGSVSSILGLLRGRGMGDAEILAIVNPPAANRNRDALVVNVRMPEQAEWRNTPLIGASLDSTTHTVRSNHYRVNTTRLPGCVYHYHVHIYKFTRGGSVDDKDCVADQDFRDLTTLMVNLRKMHPEWEVASGGKKVGMTYDGKSAAFTTSKLPFTQTTSEGQPTFEEEVALVNIIEGRESRRRFLVRLTLADEINIPGGDISSWQHVDETVLRSLNTALVSFARWMQGSDTPEWILSGSRLFQSNGDAFELAPCYMALRGYYTGLKCSAAGLVFVADMNLTCFLAGGESLQLMAWALGCRDIQTFLESARNGLNRDQIGWIEDVLKGSKCRLKHLGHTRKIKGLGPPGNSRETEFECDGTMMTVATYYEKLAKDKEKPSYRGAVDNKGKYLYPFLPTINVGTNTRPVFVPPQLVVVPNGQVRSNKMTPDMVSKAIRYAAVKPEERYRFIQDGSGKGPMVNVLKADRTTQAFGLDLIEKDPMAVAARLLPQAQLRYAGNRVVDPGLSGSWNIDRPQMQFVQTPPAPVGGGYMYGILLVCDRPPRGDWQGAVTQFMTTIENDSRLAGVVLKRGGDPLVSNDNIDNLKKELGRMLKGGVRIVMVPLHSDSYNMVKFVGDSMGVSTQCLKWKNIENPPRGYHANVMLKVNTKLGGTNHTLISRLSGSAATAPGAGIFQNPPASISWIFDKPTMLVGIDVSHAEPGSDRESMAAVVASMDGRASQYVAHLSSQSSRVEMVGALESAMKSLITTFRTKNKVMPAHIIVYRDGVSDGQFDLVLQKELPQIQSSLTTLGYLEGTVKISIIICQKGHHTRLFYDDKASGTFINPCPGLVVDGTGKTNSIASGVINEFYLNSHVAIQGTAKPCKYALIYDEIGFKISELELLTYWICYLYCRCNKSVSYATPAYYAHWASKRGKDLASAGATSGDLQAISDKWSEPGRNSTMFFL